MDRVASWCWMVQWQKSHQNECRKSCEILVLILVAHTLSDDLFERRWIYLEKYKRKKKLGWLLKWKVIRWIPAISVQLEIFSFSKDYYFILLCVCASWMGVNFHSRVSEARRAGLADEKRARNGGTRFRRTSNFFSTNRLGWVLKTILARVLFCFPLLDFNNRRSGYDKRVLRFPFSFIFYFIPNLFLPCFF